MSGVPQRVLDRFWSRVEVGEPDECWPFLMSTGNHGYGQIGCMEGGRSVMFLAHRIAYEMTNGPIPADLTVHHVCHVRRCCNPSHLRLLPLAENARENAQSLLTHCKHGHPFAGDNVRLTSRGHRTCIACRDRRNRNRYRRSR